MGITTVSSREFNQDVSRAKRASLIGPVFITDRGRPAHVLMTHDDFRRMACREPSLIELLVDPTIITQPEDEWLPPRSGDSSFRDIEFT